MLQNGGQYAGRNNFTVISSPKQFAAKDTIAVAITKDNLQEFMATCPEIAKQMEKNK